MRVSTNTIRSGILKARISPSRTLREESFNQYDPFGDTERWVRMGLYQSITSVSTNTIRSGILKGNILLSVTYYCQSFNQYDPFGDTESAHHLRGYQRC